MSMNKYVSLLSIAAVLAGASSVSAADCNQTIPTTGSTLTLPCGPSAGPRSVGTIKYNGAGLPNGSFVFYTIDLKSGISTNAYPTKTDGISQVEKKGGGFCPDAFDNIPGSLAPVSKDCELLTAFRAKKYRITVG